MIFFALLLKGCSFIKQLKQHDTTGPSETDTKPNLKTASTMTTESSTSKETNSRNNSNKTTISTPNPTTEPSSPNTTAATSTSNTADLPQTSIQVIPGSDSAVSESEKAALMGQSSVKSTQLKDNGK